MRARYPILAAAVLLACGAADAQAAKESLPIGPVHGNQITTTGLPVIELGPGIEVRVSTLPDADDIDSTDDHIGWRYQWLVAGTPAGDEVEQNKQDAPPSFTIPTDDYDKTAQLCMKAVASSGYPSETQVSAPTCSSPLLLAISAPTANSVAITGTAVVGQSLVGDYTFADAHDDQEEGTTFQWYSADDASGLTNRQVISGATAKTYTMTTADKGKYLIFGVTPRSATGVPNAGTEVLSTASARVIFDMIDNFSGPDGQFTNWNDANNYCENLDQHGYSDWRLPSKVELESLYSRHPNNDINTAHYWPTNLYYWSATLYGMGPTYYFVNLNNGYVTHGSGAPTDGVTCVR